MKKTLLITVLIFISNFGFSQNVGDTIKIRGFNYNSITRDTMISFPNNPSLTFEKILLKYSMRCKDGLISTGSDRDLGCGEWDYSCNTYIADSSKIEKVPSIQKNYVISNFTGTSYPYTTLQTYNHYDFTQKNVVVNSSNGVTQHSIGTNSINISNLIRTNQKTGRSQVLITAAELSAAGLTAGNINAITLNVTNSGGLAKFLKLQIKNSTLASLETKNATFTGFTEVFFRDYTFVNGVNTIQFHTPYNWNGTSNIILDISFTNSNNGTNIEFQGFNNTNIRTITADNIYSADLTHNGIVELNNQFLNTINNEISVSFWAKGDADLMPSSNSILYGYSNNNINIRQLNLHLPWDNSIYFDCGNVANSFDRINNPYTNLNEIKGEWNHWTFTKNAITGNMTIYLNGSIWLSGTGKNRAVTIMNLVLGHIPTANNSNYKGKVKELSIWNTELSSQTILDWKNKTIDATHPNYSSLVAYYKLNEESGQLITDSKNNITATGTNLKWDYERGDKLTTNFTESSAMPMITFLKGTYNLTVTNDVVRYSHPKLPRTVNQYSITSREGFVPMQHDIINLVSTNNYFDAVPENVYNGDTSTILSTIPVATQGTITISDLPYFKRFPFYNELVSFVTPYGIGLDFGMQGKSWYFDMSDYVKLLKGNKRLVMSGGIWQEDMDLEFLFIVGTPPRNIVQYDQLWQGAIRTDNIPIAGIINGTAMPAINFPFSSNATSFKLKSSITGHGSEGEFSQNGGVVSHRININNVQKFNWQITQQCADNPIYPQGGTWIYNRQGWCPGQRTLLKEQDLTPHVTPGSTMEVRYTTSNPANPSGDYRYIVAHQVVGYGAPNFTNDAAIISIKQPNNTNAEYSRINPMCEKPKITVRNTGANTITSINFEYWLNNVSSHQTYTWTGSIASMAELDIQLPLNTLWSSGVQATGNKFHAKIVSVNNSTDQYSNNNSMTSPLTLPDVLPNTFKISLRTNNIPSQNNYTLYDANGNVVNARTFTTANTVHTYTYQAPQISSGCYRLRVNDTGGDGLQFWANTSQGAGYVRILDSNNNIIKSFNPDFGSGFDYSFSVNTLLENESFEFTEELKVYPNPTYGSFTIEGTNLANSTIKIYDILGHLIKQTKAENNIINFNQNYLSTGVYLIKIEKDNQTTNKKLIIN